MNCNRTPLRRRQGGVTIVVVLILLSVMLLGGLALARMTASGTMIAGNITFKERALQASEVGLNTAFAAITVATFNEETNSGDWYFAKAAAVDDNQLPKGRDLTKGQKVDVGEAGKGGVYEVRYIVERMCSVDTVKDTEKECLLREAMSDVECVPGPGSNCSDIDPPVGRQFRITARVSGPKGTITIVQSMVTRGD